MSGQGIVSTARGERLNIDELIMLAKRPLDYKDKNTEIPPAKPYTRAINVRGYAPPAGTSARTFPIEKPVIKAPPSRFAGGEAKTMADLTGIRVDEPRHIKEKPEDTEAVVSKSLRTMLGQMEKMASQSVKASEQIEKHRKRTKKDDDLTEVEA